MLDLGLGFVPVVKSETCKLKHVCCWKRREPIELPPAEIEDRNVLVQFDKFKPFIGELLAGVREGTVAEPVPVMNDGSTFAIHGETRTFRSSFGMLQEPR